MSTTSRPASVIRRSTQVYVLVPSSSYRAPPISRKDSLSSLESESPASSPISLKENTPLRPTRTNSELTSMTTLSTLSSKSNKRKHVEESDLPLAEEKHETKGPKAKKPRVSSNSGASKPTNVAKKPKATSKAKTVSEPKENGDEYPNGFFYCHQCTKKRDLSLGIQCTFKDAAARTPDHRCRLKYCMACLKNRYQEDLGEIKSESAKTIVKKEKSKHITSAGYFYQCPRCRDDCNCRVCRKAKGLEPTGNLKNLARKAAAEPSTQLLNDPKATREALAKPLPVPSKSTAKKAKVAKVSPEEDKSKSQSAPKPVPKAKPVPKPKAKPAPPPKPLPKPVWTRVPVALNQEGAEARIHIREFILRFASVLQIANSNVDEFEEIAGESLGTLTEWEDQDDVELVGWVSEGCLKATILGLMDAIAGAVEANGTKEQVRMVKEAIKAIRTGGPNLTRIWSLLASLRESLGQVGNVFTFDLSDPLPPPTTAIYRSTRSGQQGSASEIHIASSAQLVQVILELLEMSLHAPVIREAIEVGATDEKELAKDAKDAVNKENTRWKEAKTAKESKGGLQAQKERHNQTIQNIEYAHRVAVHRCIPRFMPIGRDPEGRIYFALSPGAAERDSAIQLLGGKDVKVKFGRKRGPFTEEDRKERWSWFVAIWGRKPPGAVVAKDEDDTSEDEDEDEECWWGFWDHKEISNLANWLSIKHGLDVEQPQLTALSSKPKAQDAANSSRPSSSRARNSMANSRALSPLSDLSSDEDDDPMNIDCGPTRLELSRLVRSLKEFGEVLQWRIQRVAGDEVAVSVKQTIAPPKAIPAARFYGTA